MVLHHGGHIVGQASGKVAQDGVTWAGLARQQASKLLAGHLTKHCTCIHQGPWPAKVEVLHDSADMGTGTASPCWVTKLMLGQLEPGAR
jgi:hypothetical protein